MTQQEIQNYWQYCLSIERNLAKTTDFVEVCEANKDTYSFEYAKIIMLACSEVETLCKLLCNEIQPDCGFTDSARKDLDMRNYASVIFPEYPSLINFEVWHKKMHCAIVPFAKCKDKGPPTWWESYQKVKHCRHAEYHLSTQATAFEALAALIALNIYLYRRVVGEYPVNNMSLFYSKYFIVPAVYKMDDEISEFAVTS